MLGKSRHCRHRRLVATPQRPHTYGQSLATLQCSMSSHTGTTDTEYGNIPVSTEFRQKLRVAKAEAGDTYEEYLRKHVSLE